MPRVIVADENGARYLDEAVTAELLRDSYYSRQIVQRLGWALADAAREKPELQPVASP